MTMLDMRDARPQKSSLEALVSIYVDPTSVNEVAEALSRVALVKIRDGRKTSVNELAPYSSRVFLRRRIGGTVS
jgi:hypothetical protein